MTPADLKLLIGALILIKNDALERGEDKTAKQIDVLIESLQEKSKEVG